MTQTSATERAYAHPNFAVLRLFWKVFFFQETLHHELLSSLALVFSLILSEQ